MSANNQTVTDQFMNTVSEMHSAQDGLSLAVITSLFLTIPDLLPIIGVVLGFGTMKGMNRLVFAKKSLEIVRVDDIRDNPEYFLVTYVIATPLFTAFLHYATIFVPYLS